jgi:hypothetical protein
MVALAKAIKNRGGRVSLREVAAELAAAGYTTPSGQHHSASSVQSMLDAYRADRHHRDLRAASGPALFIWPAALRPAARGAPPGKAAPRQRPRRGRACERRRRRID